MFLFYSTLSAGELQKDLDVSKSTTTEKNSDEYSNPRHRLRMGGMLNKGFLRPRRTVYKYNEPADLINMVPFLRDLNEMIPRQFSLAEHEFILDLSQVIIRHEWMDKNTRRSPKTSIISMSYTSSVANYGSHLDVPLFYSSKLGFSDWTYYPLGNYTVTFNRNNPFSQEKKFYIRAVTRF